MKPHEDAFGGIQYPIIFIIVAIFIVPSIEITAEACANLYIYLCQPKESHVGLWIGSISFMLYSYLFLELTLLILGFIKGGIGTRFFCTILFAFMIAAIGVILGQD
ncbi:MAG: hypothetical protein LBT05_00425 [Planctomycetaceae bacterium]|jgi:hypothetical protein|nr:hypothetical protein [Planctomycetaceae bacterium]